MTYIPTHMSSCIIAGTRTSAAASLHPVHSSGIAEHRCGLAAATFIYSVDDGKKPDLPAVCSTPQPDEAPSLDGSKHDGCLTPAVWAMMCALNMRERPSWAVLQYLRSAYVPTTWSQLMWLSPAGNTISQNIPCAGRCSSCTTRPSVLPLLRRGVGLHVQ